VIFHFGDTCILGIYQAKGTVLKNFIQEWQWNSDYIKAFYCAPNGTLNSIFDCVLSIFCHYEI